MKEREQNKSLAGFEYVVGVYELKYKDLAEELNISPKTVNDWVKGRSNIPSKHLQKLVVRFGVSEDLLTRTELKLADKLKIQLAYFHKTDEKIEIKESFEIDGEEHTRTIVHYSNEGVITHLQEELLIVERQEELQERIEVAVSKLREDDPNNPFLVEKFFNYLDNNVRLLEQEDASKVKFANAILHFLLNFSDVDKSKWDEIDPFNDLEYISAIKKLYSTFEGKGNRGSISFD